MAMIRIVYTNIICAKFNGACLKGSYDECETDCEHQRDKEQLPAFEGVGNYYQTAASE